MHNSSDDETRIREAILQDRAQQKQQTQERLREGRALRALIDGQGSGPLPYGYVRLWDNGAPTGRITIDEDAATLVRRIFELRDQGMLADGIATIVGREGFRTGSGKFLTGSGVTQILSHEELYRTGIRMWGGEQAAIRWPILLDK